MRRWRFILPTTILFLSVVGQVRAQDRGIYPLPAQLSPVPVSPPAIIPPAPPTQEQEIVQMLHSMEALNRELVIVQARAVQDDKLKMQVDLLQKQIEVQQKMIQLLMDQLKKPAPGSSVDRLQTQVAVLEGRSVQAAQRDQELAQQVDSIVEHQDVFERNGLQLPATLSELFLNSGNNETPLSIYGTLSFGYSKIIGNAATAANGAGRPPTPGGFYFGEFTPDFFLKLNDWILLEAEIGIGGDGSVSAGSFAQADFFLTDWLTVSAGRFVVPIGFFNLRLNTPWINKLPNDAPGSGPLLWQQVLPAFSMLGMQASGAFYLFDSPLKMEYNLYFGNGLNLTPATPGAPTLNELANLENMESTFATVSNKLAAGGRIGLWWPELGLNGGISGLHNPSYVAGFDHNSINLWALDFNFHKGNWDIRAEYGVNNQQAMQFINTNITRQGLYAQIAYRPYDADNRYLQNLEMVYRYSYADFKGINPTSLDLSTFNTPMDVPVRRQQNEIGINYYFYPRAVMKFAFQINDEPGFHLHDNQFIAEFDWGF